jgi:hypothetical protein
MAKSKRVSTPKPKKFKAPKAPKSVTSTFALVEISKGREYVRKLVENDHRVPFTLRGYLIAGKANIGPADEVGTEFAANIEGITIGSPEFVVLDKAGREYAMSANTFVGDKLQCDDGFDCLVKGTVKKVLGDAEGLPYIKCADGKHYLSGQIGNHGELVGLYKVD